MTTESARLGVAPERISVFDAIRWLIGIEGMDVTVLVVNPARPGRVEPRVVKRRPEAVLSHDRAPIGTPQEVAD